MFIPNELQRLSSDNDAIAVPVTHVDGNSADFDGLIHFLGEDGHFLFKFGIRAASVGVVTFAATVVDRAVAILSAIVASIVASIVSLTRLQETVATMTITTPVVAMRTHSAVRGEKPECVQEVDDDDDHGSEEGKSEHGWRMCYQRVS
jgi:hypothetical protein